MRRIIYIVPVAALLALGIVLTLQRRPQERPDPAGVTDRNGPGPARPLPNGGDPDKDNHDPHPPAVETGTVAIFAQDGGRAVPAVSVLMVPDGGHDHDGHCDSESFRGTTLADGVVEFREVPAGAWRIRAKHRKYAPVQAAVEVRRGQRHEVPLALIEGGVIAGTVIDTNGQALPGARVSILDPESLKEIHPALTAGTQEDGAYLIEGAPLKEFVLYARHPRYKPGQQDGLSFANPGELLQVDFILEAGNVITGRVLTHNGIPIAGATVGASNETAWSVVTGEEGRFEIYGLGDGAVSLFARAKGYSVVYLRGLEPNTTDLEIRLFKAGSIAGRVEADGALEAFTILLYRFEDDLNRELRVATKRFERTGGEFLLPDVAKGLYHVSAVAPGYEESERIKVPVDIEQDVRGLVLRLQRK